MKMILLRPYGIRRVGDILSSVPSGRAKQFILNGVAIPAEEKPKPEKKKRGRPKCNTKQPPLPPKSL